MPIPVYRRSDAIAGLALAALGAGTVFMSSDLDPGSLRNMGPGFFPLVLGVLLALCGAGLVLADLMRHGPAVELPPGLLRALAVVLAAVMAFALMVKPAGMIPAVLAVVLISALASGESRVLRSLMLAVVLALACWAIFVLGLGMQVRAVNWAIFGNV